MIMPMNICGELRMLATILDTDSNKCWMPLYHMPLSRRFATLHHLVRQFLL